MSRDTTSSPLPKYSVHSLIDYLVQLANAHPERLYQYAMDARFLCLPTHLSDWEAREPNSTAAVLNAYAYALDKILTQEPYTVEDILKIQEICTKGVCGTLWSTGHGHFNSSSDPNVCFGIYLPGVTQNQVSRNASVKGMKELATYCFDTKNYNMFSEADQTVFEALTKEKLSETLLYRAGLSKESSLQALYIHGTKNDSTNTKLYGLVKAIIEDLYSKLRMATTENEKIREIVTAIQKLERIHPFQDANCRTFCLVLLNGLLMQQGFPPAVIYNPNRFDGFSIDELVKMIEIGFIVTKNLGNTTQIQSSIRDLLAPADIPLFYILESTGTIKEVQIRYAAQLIQKIQILPLIDHLLFSTTLTDEDQTILKKIDSIENFQLLLNFFKNNDKKILLNHLSFLFSNLFSQEPFDTENFLSCLALINDLPLKKDIFKFFEGRINKKTHEKQLLALKLIELPLPEKFHDIFNLYSKLENDAERHEFLGRHGKEIENSIKVAFFDEVGSKDYLRFYYWGFPIPRPSSFSKKHIPFLEKLRAILESLPDTDNLPFSKEWLTDCEGSIVNVGRSPEDPKYIPPACFYYLLDLYNKLPTHKVGAFLNTHSAKITTTFLTSCKIFTDPTIGAIPTSVYDFQLPKIFLENAARDKNRWRPFFEILRKSLEESPDAQCEYTLKWVSDYLEKTVVKPSSVGIFGASAAAAESPAKTITHPSSSTHKRARL